MKKVILTVMVAGALMATGCKKAKEATNDVVTATENVAGDAANAVKEGANTVVDGAKEGANAVVDGAKDAAGAVADAVQSAIEGVTIPKFEDAKVGEHLKAYSEYAKEYIAAGKDAYKNADLMKKGKELVEAGKGIVAGLDEAGKEKFNAVISAIQAKMAPAK